MSNILQLSSENTMSVKQIQLIPCACGCGELIQPIDKCGRSSIFKNGHYWNGKKHSEETKKKMSLARQGSKHPLWKGDDVSYVGLHKWVRRNFPPPEHCNMCHEKTNKLEASNISGHYLRDITDYEYLCHSCHLISEGRNITNHMNTPPGFWELASIAEHVKSGGSIR